MAKKQAQRWNARLTKLVNAKKKAKGVEKVAIQKAINAEYKKLGMDMNGKLIKKPTKKLKSKTKKKAPSAQKTKDSYADAALKQIGNAVRTRKTIKERSKARKKLTSEIQKKGIDVKSAEKRRNARVKKNAPEVYKTIQTIKNSDKPTKKKGKK